MDDTTSPWATAKPVYISAPHCAYCHATRPHIIRSISENDGSVTRRCLCRSCGARCLVVIEPPDDADPPPPAMPPAPLPGIGKFRHPAR
jgi:hypothetical protein